MVVIASCNLVDLTSMVFDLGLLVFFSFISYFCVNSVIASLSFTLAVMVDRFSGHEGSVVLENLLRDDVDSLLYVSSPNLKFRVD